jgi:hypothetical protein
MAEPEAWRAKRAEDEENRGKARKKGQEAPLGEAHELRNEIPPGKQIGGTHGMGNEMEATLSRVLGSKRACRSGRDAPVRWQKQRNWERVRAAEERNREKARKKGQEVPLGEVGLSEKWADFGNSSLLTPSVDRGKWRRVLARAICVMIGG